MNEPAGPGGIADLTPVFASMQRQQKAWYWYDWANSAYATTIGTVMFGPYFIGLAENAAGGEDQRLSVLGMQMEPGSLFFWLITISTIFSALLLPPLGALADRTANKKGLLAGFAWTGAAAACLIFFARGDNWLLAAVGIVIGNICFGAAGVFNDAILPWISTENERDRVSSRGWAWGYLGGGLLLAVNLAFFITLPFGLTEAAAARWCMLSAALWWAGFTFIPFLKLRNYQPVHVVPESGGIVRQSFGQLGATLRDLRNYPMALTFLLAYLFFNDGIQTVIAAAAVYGKEELGHGQTILIATILMVQFVAFGGALFFGRLARIHGAKRTILTGLVMWMVIVTVALFLPKENVPLFLAMGFAIGLVLGGTQALARSYFSLLIPRGKEAEYFSFYHAMDRGTSWFGTATMAIMLQLTGSYRPAIFALIVFFVLGGYLLTRVDTVRGIREAGNEVPQVV